MARSGAMQSRNKRSIVARCTKVMPADENCFFSDAYFSRLTSHSVTSSKASGEIVSWPALPDQSPHGKHHLPSTSSVHVLIAISFAMSAKLCTMKAELKTVLLNVEAFESIFDHL